MKIKTDNKKRKYKLAIKKAKNEQTNDITNELHESLLNKNAKCFWKTWKCKVCNNKKTNISIEGNITDSEAVNRFASFFKKNSAPNTLAFDIEKKAELSEKLKHYVGREWNTKLYFNAEIVTLSLDKMKTGKSCGVDNLSLEHITNCHPIIVTILSSLFNKMLELSYVPTDFGRGITIPIPKNDDVRGPQKIELFRGITLSPIISKLFEHCILTVFSEFLISSDNQFGFKTGVGCAHAVYSVRKTVDYFVSNNSTINLCFLDIAKGFDKINHSVIMLKLMKRNVPIVLINLLLYWYNISNNIVRWKGLMSEPYKLLAGVRQGGVLSPTLFSIYVDDFLKKFNKFGCCFHGISISAVMYADDLVLLAPSIVEMQTMLDYCVDELNRLDLNINPAKTKAIRIGSRFNAKCVNLYAHNEIIAWAQEVKYLGIHIKEGPTFKCSFVEAKIKFYHASNGILAKIGNKDNKAVSLNLIASMALPILTYALEALVLNKSELLALNHPWERSFEKVFHTFNKDIVKQCQQYMGYLPVHSYYYMKSFTFLKNLEASPNQFLRMIFNNSGNEDICRLAKCMNCTSEIAFRCFREIIVNNFLEG